MHVNLRRQWLAALALGTSPFPALAHAQAASGRPAFIEIIVITDRNGNDLLRPVLAVGDEEKWVANSDYPADAIAAGQKGFSVVRLTVDAQDRVTECVPMRGNAGPALDQFACRMMRERGHFRHALSSAGAPVTNRVDVQFSFDLDQPMMHPPAPPPAPPGGYAYVPSLRLTKADWASAAPPGKPSGEVAISFSIYQGTYGRPEGRYCYVARSSGNTALDEATCAAAKAASYERISTTSSYGASLAMLVIWKRGKARVEFPSRPRVTPLAIDGGDAAIVAATAPSGVTQRGVARLTFHPGGRIDCRIAGSTGSDDSDRAVCNYIRTKIRFTPEVDIFGREVPASRWFRFQP